MAGFHTVSQSISTGRVQMVYLEFGIFGKKLSVQKGKLSIKEMRQLLRQIWRPAWIENHSAMLKHLLTACTTASRQLYCAEQP